MVPANSYRISRVPYYSGYHYNSILFRLRDYHTLWSLFPKCSATKSSPISWSYYPDNAETLSVWATSRSFATTKEITIVFFSSGYLDVSVHRVRLPLQEYLTFSQVGCPIRKSADRRLCAPLRSLSQLVTSFFASKSQGIHHAPFVTYSFLLFARKTLFLLCVFLSKMSKNFPSLSFYRRSALIRLTPLRKCCKSQATQCLSFSLKSFFLPPA